MNKRTLLFTALVIVLVGFIAVGGVLVYVSSPGFKEVARRYVVKEMESRLGGHVTLGRLHWDLWNQRIHILDLTLHGQEPADGPPLAHIETVEIGLNLRTLLKRRLDLFELTVTRPEFHLFVDAKGSTNLPSPPPRNDQGTNEYQVSIENFKIAQGFGFINERQIHMDFTLRNIQSELSYHSTNRIMTAHIAYDGIIDPDTAHDGVRVIPYSLAADFDFTRGTVLAKHVVWTSGKTKVQFQGRINDALTKNVSGTLEYSGSAATSFMNYFFPTESFIGESTVAGGLEFSNGHFYTHGRAKGASIGFSGWNATAFESDYAYRYPEKRLTVEHLTAQAFDGSAEGTVIVEALPGPSHITLDIRYKDINSAALVRAYPWDPKYRIESRLTGQLQGWFEGRFERFEFTGGVSLDSAAQRKEADVVALPLSGDLGFTLRHGMATVHNANLRLLSTAVQADGAIEGDRANLRVHMTSSDLRDLAFLYADANGTGSFDGVLNGPVKTPQADGTFDLRQYRYREWTIEQVAGSARVDTLASVASLTNVRVVQGQSQLTLSGNTTLDGAKVDIRIQAPHVRAEDAEPFIKRKLGGVFSGAIHVVSLAPLRFDGDVRAAGLLLDGQSINDIQSHVQYDDPSITLQNLAVADRGSTLAGRATYNTTTEAMTFNVRINSVDFERLRPFGLPDGLEGAVQQADLTGNGTRALPQVNGTARLQNLSFHGETFPQARVDIRTANALVNVKVSETRNLDLTADIDTTAGKGYPFTAQASFKRYSIERLAGFTRGTMIVTGSATLDGSLKEISKVSGKGRIDPVELVIQGQPLQSTKPFAFDFNSERLKLIDDVTVAGLRGTELSLKGTVGLTPGAKLDLTLTGQVNAGILASDNDWTIGGIIGVKGQVGGTLSKPDLLGRATLLDLSVARQGMSMALTGLRGDVIFDEHRMTLANVEGRSSGGTVRLQGNAAIEGDTIGALNIRVDADGVRVRYPAGVRSVVKGALAVGGTMASPSISGDIEIQSLTLNSSFDEFLNLFGSAAAPAAASPFGGTRLSLNITGNRNISIRNELAVAEARVDLGIKGTVDKPALTGRVETSSGTLIFNGRKYDVTRGNIDFVDPVRINPTISIQAETSVRNYQVYLSIAGRMDRLQLNMRSEPALPQLEIVNLISGGKTSDELAQSAGSAAAAGALPTGERVFQGGAASILSDMLLSRVGSKFNLMGLDRIVRIDPFVVGSSNTATARITLSEQLTKDLSVTYSTDLGASRQQIIQIEYFITKNISVLASKDENDVRALDLRIRKRF